MTTFPLDQAGFGLSRGRLVAAGDFDEAKHPRDNHGRFGDKDDDTSMSLASSPREVRDALVDSYRTNFLRDLGDYPERVAAAEADKKQWPVSANSAQDSYWRVEHGYKTDAYERALVNGFVKGDTRAIGTIRANATRQVGELHLEALRPEAVATMHEAVRLLNADPDAQALMGKYGVPTIIAAATKPGYGIDSGDTPSGDCATDGKIRLFENVFERSGDVYPAGPGDLRPGGATVNSFDRLGVLTHEFGHHVNNGIDPDQQTEWNHLYAARKNGYEAEFRNARDVDGREAVQARTVSYYAMNSGRPGNGDRQEGFAETFAAVMHPDYDRALFDPSNHPMLEFMENIVKDAHK